MNIRRLFNPPVWSAIPLPTGIDPQKLAKTIVNTLTNHTKYVKLWVHSVQYSTFNKARKCAQKHVQALCMIKNALIYAQ